MIIAGDLKAVAWFAAKRLAEEKASARAAAAYGGSENWRVDIENDIRPDPARDNGYIACGPFGGGLLDQHAAHIARYDPARALREVEAGERILARHGGSHWCPTGPQDDDWVYFEAGERKTGVWPCADMLDLLSRWRDHPDYPDELRTAAAPGPERITS